MQRIMIIGCAGAGKTTLAQNLAERLSIPWFSLDKLHWKQGWVSTDKTIMAIRQQEVLAGDHWIIEGNYTGIISDRLACADTIIFLDFPLYICLPRVLWRCWKYRGRVRPHMAAGCSENFDPEFLRYVIAFRKERRPELFKLFDTFDGKQIRLTRKSAVTGFLQSLS